MTFWTSLIVEFNGEYPPLDERRPLKQVLQHVMIYAAEKGRSADLSRASRLSALYDAASWLRAVYIAPKSRILEPRIASSERYLVDIRRSLHPMFIDILNMERLKRL